jgi:hypothetical protein
MYDPSKQDLLYESNLSLLANAVLRSLQAWNTSNFAEGLLECPRSCLASFVGCREEAGRLYQLRRSLCTCSRRRTLSLATSHAL